MVPQAGLFSVALTEFLVDSKQDLKPSPADESVYYLRQYSTILSQISAQLSSIGPQVSIPPAPPPPFPPFSPLASDVRVNVFWFMALAFSLLAALLAILVQQWVRKYMHVFQRHGDPLKSSRLRQYLYEGCEKSYMRKVAEAVPGFLHISVFLFFAGLGDSLLNINTKVALSTIVPIGVSGLLYIFITFAPIINPQSPYHNSFSGIVWYLFQNFRGRRFRDRGPDGGTKTVSANMAQGQMQLAMEATEARKGRDVRAIRWLIDNQTEDAEMETFLPAIPGSFNTDWGTEVWKRVGKHQEREEQSQDEPVARPHTTTHPLPSSWAICSVLRSIIRLVRKPAPNHFPAHPTTHSPVPHPPSDHPHSTPVHILGEGVMHELSTRVARSVKKCKNLKLFPNNDSLWQKHARACIEATASLVCCANAKLAWFAGISELLGDIGDLETIRELSLAGTDELFVTRWTCLSLVSIRPILENNKDLQGHVAAVVEALISFSMVDDTGNNDVLATTQKIDGTIRKANECVFRLGENFRKRRIRIEDLTEEVLRGYESQFSELEQINNQADRLACVDSRITDMLSVINLHSHQIISQIPGVVLNDFDRNYKVPPRNSLFEFEQHLARYQKPRFICPGKTLKDMCLPAVIVRNILEGQGDADANKELLKNLICSPFWYGLQVDLIQRQLWRLQDLHQGGGLGFTVELFFLALSQLLSTSSSRESHSALYTGTFRAITHDWSKHKKSLGTQKLLLRIAIEFDESYPVCIVDEFLLFLGNIFEGQSGPHIDEARQRFERYVSLFIGQNERFSGRVLKVLTSAGQAQ